MKWDLFGPIPVLLTYDSPLDSITTKFIDMSIAEIKENGSISNTTEESVLEKLLKIDKRVAIIMALDMLMAGVDTVIHKPFPFYLISTIEV